MASRYAPFLWMGCLAMALVSCGKDDSTAPAAGIATGMTDTESTACVVGKWQATASYQNFTTVNEKNYAEDGTYTQSLTYSSSGSITSVSFYAGTWSVLNGELSEGPTRSGSGATLTAAMAAAADIAAAERFKTVKGLVCSSTNLSTDGIVGGDISTFIGTWRSLTDDYYAMKDGVLTLAEGEMSTTVLNADGKGTSLSTDTDYNTGGTWLTPPAVQERRYLVCSWSKTATTLTVTQSSANATACSGSETPGTPTEYFVVGSVVGLWPFTRQ